MEPVVVRELSELLKSMFSGEELRRWVTFTFGREVADDLPGAGVSLAQLSFDVAMALQRHGLIDDRLVEALGTERPARRAEILAAARSWRGGPATTGAKATPAAPAPGRTGTPRGNARPAAPEPAQTESVVRVLHLSDFHFRARTHWDASPVLDRLTTDVAGLVRDGLAPDLIVLTGDIAQSGKEEEYALARTWIQSRLLPAAEVGVERLVIVPGNHDADRDRIGKGARHMADGLREARNQQDVTDVLGGEEGALLLRRLDAYVAFVNSLGVAGTPLVRPWYRVTHEIRGVRIHCAALASAWLSADDRDYGQLLLGLWQCNEVLRGADDAHVVLAALHHPWDYVGEWDRAASLAEIERSVGLVLRGHLHEGRHDYRQSARHAGVLELAAGACYEASEYPNSYHLIEIWPDAPEQRRARIHPRFWNPSRREWQPDLNVFGGPSGELPLRVRSTAGPVSSPGLRQT